MSKLGTIALQGLKIPMWDAHQNAVLRRMADCQTPKMGGNVLECQCGHREVHYNSCRDRHCPLCQGAARARWVKDRLTELLPTPYFHVVFTIPHELSSLAFANKRVVYRALFHSAHETLLDVCANPENLGARAGGLSVLHTWNQKLAYHPHLHCIVPGGGVSEDGTKWVKGNPGYLVSVKRLSAVFRGKFLNALEKALLKGNIIGDTEKYWRDLRRAAAKSFVVYAKQPFGGPEQVLKYLGRYTHRVGISEQRIVSCSEKEVKFSWLDRGAGHCRKIMGLSLENFIRKFMLHLLPKSFRKIRYFGYMGNRNRGVSIRSVRALIVPVTFDPQGTSSISENTEVPSREPKVCRHCGASLGIVWKLERVDFVLFSGLRLTPTHGPEPSLQVPT
jgi:hypothetical protein